MVGRTILHYRIVGTLGAGGMGVVYEAHDLTLDRVVALKFLPAELAADAGALERFQREARAASALNHPAICTIYAFEQAETDEGLRHFLAMERLEGQSLDRVLSGPPLPVEHALELGIQVADALDAAHTRGIIHRDIKPANIFVQPRNRAKVLDFGLAKLAAARVGVSETMTVEPADILTSPGTTLGTVAYMSPEQARGEELDVRTDLFSFGAVLYQMCTGRAPFGGKTSAVIFQKILDKDPEPPRALNPALPPRLEEIVLKALEKDRDLRCQSAAELRADLKRLQRDTTAGRRADAGADSDRQPAVASQPSMPSTGQASSGAVLITEARRHKVGVAVAASALIALVAAAGFGVYRAISGDRSTAGTAERLSITPFTTSGDVRGCTSISPDGRYVVYCETERATGTPLLRIRQVATGATVKLADGGGTTTFSPDGNFVYIVRDNAVFVVPAIGGEEPQRLTPPGMRAGAVAVSPDGQEIAFLRRSLVEAAIIVAPRDGSSERTLFSVPISDGLIGIAPAWSPDGTMIAAGYRDGRPGTLSAPAVVDVASGKLRKLAQPRWTTVHRVLWLHDGSGLVISAVQPGEIHNQLWLVSYPSGETKRITNDLDDYGSTSIGISRDDTIAVAQFTDAGDIWISDPAGANATSVTSGTAFNTVIGWTGDNQLVFMSQKPVKSLWTTSASGGAPRRVPVDLKDAQTIRMGPGHNWIAYTNAGSTPGIGRVNLDGTGRLQLTQSPKHANPRPTSDGAWILYADWESKAPATWKVPAAGGQPVLLGERVGHPVPSPDGQRYWAATLSDPGREEPVTSIGIFGLSDGKLEKAVRPERIGSFIQTGQPLWAPDGQSLVFIRTDVQNVSNLWTFPLDGTESRQLTQFERDLIFSYAFSSDGKMLATSRGRVSGDIVLIRNFR